jgi:hypothetical protein
LGQPYRELQNSPFIEVLKKKGYEDEVILRKEGKKK